MARRSSSSSSSSCRQYLHSAYYIRRLMRLAFVFVIFADITELGEERLHDHKVEGWWSCGSRFPLVQMTNLSMNLILSSINVEKRLRQLCYFREAVTSNDAVRTCEAKMGAASTSALHGSRVGRGLQLAPVGGPRPPPPRWRRASGRLQRSRYGGSSAHP
ncbi:hypothetical protein MUK42_08073 [Musa troglodytarum]|uniref:Uncharacterized protein n=1 Tax=Musa troglodytarum TaxID=320322 RepID=A0A9E7L0T1_9LILI|nr:hypothetical protein MUK42_08073 [Musa troglodytarum]